MLRNSTLRIPESAVPGQPGRIGDCEHQDAEGISGRAGDARVFLPDQRSADFRTDLRDNGKRNSRGREEFRALHLLGGWTK
jgi:hypothetical protein